MSRLFFIFAVPLSLILGSVDCQIVQAQNNEPEPHPYMIYDLNDDGRIDGLDANKAQIDLTRIYGSIARGTRHRVNEKTLVYDFNFDWWIDILDIVILMEHAGHFEIVEGGQDGDGSEDGDGSGANGDASPIVVHLPLHPGSTCLMGDLHPDGEFTEADQIAFEIGFHFWQWYNIICGPSPAVYSFGDLNLDGCVDESDWLLLEAQFILHGQHFPDRSFPANHTSSNAPSDKPFGWFTWICGPG